MSDVPLRDYLEKRIAALEHQFQRELEANATAVNKAEADMTRRLEGMNEFRHQLNSQASTFVTKDELQIARDAVLSEIKNLRTIVDDRVAAQWKAIYAIGIAVAGLQAAIVYFG